MVSARLVQELQDSGIAGGCQFKGSFTRRDTGPALRSDRTRGECLVSGFLCPGGLERICGVSCAGWPREESGCPSGEGLPFFPAPDMKKPPVRVTRGPLGSARRE